MQIRSKLLHCLPLLAAASLVAQADAQTVLSGNVSDGTTGPLLTGQVYVTGANLTVPTGQTLTIQPGAVLKFGGGHLLTVSGTLAAPGGATAHLTSASDDSVAGDTNGNGPSAGAKADWAGVRVLAGGAIDLRNTSVRYAGSAGFSPIYGQGGTIRLVDCLLADSNGPGIDANGLDVELIVTNTVIADCSGFAMDEVRIEQVPNLTGNTASGNGAGDTIHLANVVLDRDTDIVAENLLDGTLVLTQNAVIPAFTRLGLGPNIALKFSSGLLVSVSGSLEANGTPLEPVVFTSIADDQVFGDTIGDGPTSGSPGDWAGIRAIAGGTIQATHTTVRFPGASGWTGFYVQGGTVDLNHCAVEFSAGAGIDFTNTDLPSQVVACRFDNNFGVAIDRAPIQILAGFDSNTGTGNLGGNFLRTSPFQSIDSVERLGPRNLINGTVVIPTNLDIGEFGELVVEPGTAVKFAPATVFTIRGRLTARGTATDQILFSSFADDTMGGDSNLDGPSFGSPADWGGIRTVANMLGTAGVVDLEQVLIRNGGFSSFTNLSLVGGGHVLRAVRSEASFQEGFRLPSICAGLFVNCVAVGNLGAGFLLGSSSPLIHATASANFSGVDTLGSPLTAVRNSILWGNAQDLRLDPNTTVTHTTASNAPAGGGNSNLDPLFVDAFGGDLRLGMGSPAVDAADSVLAVAVAMDALDAPRLLAPVGTFGLAADQGAFEQARWSLVREGVPAIGEPVVLRVEGEPGQALLAFATGPGALVLDPLGVLLLDPIAFLEVGIFGVGASNQFPLPAAPVLVGLEINMQALVFAPAIPSFGQLTDVERFRIQPALP